MSLSEHFGHAMQHPFLEKLGWALLHFMWQGMVTAIAVGLVLLLMRRASANARYLASCAGMLLMAVLPMVTLAILPDRQLAGTAADKIDSDFVRPDNVTHPLAVAEDIPIRGSANDFSASPPIAGTEVDVLPAIQLDVAQANDPLPSKSLLERGEVFLQPWLPTMIVVWLLGVVALAVRLLLTWTEVQRLQVRGVVAADTERALLMQELAGRLGVRKVVRLLESSLVEVPTVIGWLKPVILLPIATVNALTMSQLEAILAHELAHVRRADYIVNLLQSLIETLLFYHPAVWWISSRIRQEREHCCDDLAASMSGDAPGYVAALVRMEELRCEPRGVAMAARGGNLLSRVRRLLVPTVPDRIAPRWVTGAAAMLIAAALVGIPLLTKSQAGPAVAQEANSKQDKSADSSGETDEQSRTKENAKPIPAPASDNLEEITPAQIADRIDEARKRYSSVEYTAEIRTTHNTTAFEPDAKPTLVEGTGTVLYRSDGSRWFSDQRSFNANQKSMRTYPTQTISAFDGNTHQVLDRNLLKIGQEGNGERLYAAAEFFWQGGISSEWLLAALRRPEATLVERIQMAETSCLHVVVEWKPEWSIDEVETTESGLHYPVEFKIRRPETATVPSMAVRISKFQDRSSFEPHEFQIPVTPEIDVIDYRSGFAWHNDPWWNELAPWAKENLDWPQPDLKPLSSLRSYSGPEIAGTTAPELVLGEWLTTPGDLTWDRPGRNVTVLYFFGGRLIDSTPEQLIALEHLYRKYASSGVEIIGIASQISTPEQVRQTIRELNPSFPVMIDAKANEAGIPNKVSGVEWGANYVRYQLGVYTGTVVVDKSGKVRLVDPQAADLPDGMSSLESLIRNELLKSPGLTVQGTLPEFASPSSRIPDETWNRLEDEWKKRAAAATGTGIITGRIQQRDEAQLTGAKAMIVVEPVLRVLFSNTPGGWNLGVDRNRIRRIESDAAGAFLVDNLPKGSYRITVTIPDKPRATRTVHLTSHDSQVELNVELSGGDRISGRITDADGNAIPKTAIKAVKRFTSSDDVDAGMYTTEHLPGPPTITNDSGDFSFEMLHEGAYEFEVRAEGFETTTTEAVPAGSSDLRVILKPAFLLNLVTAHESTPTRDFSKTRERAKAVIDSVSPAIVRFTYGNEPKRQFGCGVIVSASGHVAVSGPVQYVIDDALLDLQLIDGRSVSGKALGWSSEFGVGMLKITDSGEWPHVKFSKRAEAGEVCVALGYRINSPGTEMSPGIRLGIVTKVADGHWLTTLYRSPFNAHPIFNLDGELLGLKHTSSSNGDSVHAAAGMVEAHWDELAAGGNLDRPRLDTQDADSTKPLARSEEVALEVIAKAKTASVRISEIGAEENRISGVIVTHDGYVITCGHHRCVPGTKMTVSLQDGRSANAIVLGTNLVSDIGVLKITDEGTWPYAEKGRSVDLGEGEHCVVVGYPRSIPGGDPWVFATTIAKAHWTLPGRDEFNCGFRTKGSSLGKGGVSGCGVFDAQGRVIGVLLGGADGRSASGADLSQLRISRVELFRKNWEALTSSMPVHVADTNQLAEITTILNRIADELSAEDHR